MSVVPVSAARLPPISGAAHAAAAELGRALKGRISLDEQDRLAYSRDMWPKALLWVREGRIPPPPDAVVWPRDEAEVVEIVRIARAHRIPLIPFGAGSGVCGGVLAVQGGIAVDLKRLERVGRVDPESLTVEAQAGVLGEVLERNLNAQGYTLGHFPSSIYMSTLGGWLAARSAGQLSSLYGKIEDMTVGVRAVLGTGEVVATPQRPRRGPDLAQLLIGSEGTLCLFTAATLRVHPYPEERAFRGLRFRTVAEGVEAMRRLFRAGLRPAVARLYDPFDTALVARSRHKGPATPPSLRGVVRADVLPALTRQLSARTLGRPGWINRAADLFRSCLLVLMFEGEARRTAREEEHARALCLRTGGEDLGEEPARNWYRERYAVSYKMSKVVDNGAFADTMEVAATWDKVLDVYERVRAAVAPVAFVVCHFSHAYQEGCSLYFSFVASGSDDVDQERRYDQLWRTALSAAVSAGATVSHHHGVGLLKQTQLREELGEGRRMLEALKRACDPDGILNPGKLTL
ncbi:MAG: FAD-binding oxidoreductase [Myxococcaceae bacterium]|nr:FAD-binding oxidoreductase [Myxococcaceae bacterium]